MTTEEKLQDLILKRYHSVREFAITFDIPYTTINSIFRRGIGNSSVTNIIKICKALGISADALADGEIVPVQKFLHTPIDITRPIKVEDILADTTKQLTLSGRLTLDTKPLSRSEVDSIINAMTLGVELVKRKKEQ